MSLCRWEQSSVALLGALLMLAASAQVSVAADPLYASTPLDEARSRALAWIATRQLEDEQIDQRVDALWADVDANLAGRDLFEKVIETFRLGDFETNRFVSACRLLDAPLRPPETKLFSSTTDDPFYRANLQLFHGRYLARRKMYDEALAALAQIDPAAVVDPATYLYWLAVSQHQLLMKPEALKSLHKLLENTENVPISYMTTARLMQDELENLDEKTLDEISWKMRDSRRRLELGRGGEKVQKVQDEIIAGLDELIDKLDQQGQGGGGGGGSGQGKKNQSSSPAEDSSIKGSTAPGEVDPKNFRKQGEWGALPPKDAERAKNLINRNFPAHYRQAVEQYFKKLAKRRAEEGR